MNAKQNYTRIRSRNLFKTNKDYTIPEFEHSRHHYNRKCKYCGIKVGWKNPTHQEHCYYKTHTVDTYRILKNDL